MSEHVIWAANPISRKQIYKLCNDKRKAEVYDKRAGLRLCGRLKNYDWLHTSHGNPGLRQQRLCFANYRIFSSLAATVKPQRWIKFETLKLTDQKRTVHLYVANNRDAL